MTKKNKPVIELFTDGACSGNPGVGAYCAILRYNDKEKQIVCSEPLTTNNRMELMAVIAGLEALKVASKVKIYTDSQYVVNGITKWLPNWLKNNWKNSQKKDVQNRDLWERLLNAMDGHEIVWNWIRGHQGHKENELCDKLAVEAIKAAKINE